MRWESDQSTSLYHYGIKGQVHGVRRFQNYDGSLTEAGKIRYGYYDRGDGTKDMVRLQKDAAKDAKEYARAKAYYGEGAGTRRKQLKNSLSEKMKDPDYKAEFERQLKNQNMQEHQQAANRERRWEDTKQTVGRTARGVKNIILGVGSASVAAIGLVKLAQATGFDKKIANWGQTLFSKIGNLFGGGSSNSSRESYDDYRPSGPSPYSGGGGGNYRSAYDAFINRRA